MTDGQQPRRTRSPRYPGIPLGLAIERAKILYQYEKRYSAPVSAVVAHWGLTVGSSSANISVASLKSFGLLVDEGSGEKRLLRLSDLAIDILLSPEPGPAIRAAALSPGIHRELYEKYGTDLPSDATLKYELIRTRDFTDSGAQDFIAQFRKTIMFALSGETSSGLDAIDDEPATPTAGIMRDGPSNSVTANLKDVHGDQNTTTGSTLTIPIRLVGGDKIELRGNFPISETAWNHLLVVLSAMKPGLVFEDSPTQNSDREPKSTQPPTP